MFFAGLFIKMNLKKRLFFDWSGFLNQTFLLLTLICPVDEKDQTYPTTDHYLISEYDPFFIFHDRVFPTWPENHDTKV